MCVRVSTCVHVCVCECMHACMCVRVSMCVRVCAHMHICESSYACAMPGVLMLVLSFRGSVWELNSGIRFVHRVFLPSEPLSRLSPHLLFLYKTSLYSSPWPGTHYAAAAAGLKLMVVPLPQPSKCWGYKYVPLDAAQFLTDRTLFKGIWSAPTP